MAHTRCQMGQKFLLLFQKRSACFPYLSLSNAVSRNPRMVAPDTTPAATR